MGNSDQTKVGIPSSSPASFRPGSHGAKVVEEEAEGELRELEEQVDILTRIILGFAAGFIGSKIVNKHGDGILIDIALGIIGAMIGGWLFGVIGMAGATGLNIWSLFVSVVGAIALLVAYHAVRRTV
jgi:uncharacterized membrane protein YeaQ/YmgE (transglycosylase-associated protein family)